MLQEVIDPQRQGGDVEEVSHGQVDQVDAKLIALANLEEKVGRSERREIDEDLLSKEKMDDDKILKYMCGNLFNVVQLLHF